VEDDTCRDAQVVLSLRTRAEFVEARQEIIDLRGTNGKAAGYLHIDAATDGYSNELFEVENASPLLPPICATPKSTWPNGVMRESRW